MNKSVTEHRTRRQREPRWWFLCWVCSGIPAACGSVTRDFGPAGGSGGASAESPIAKAGAAGAQHPIRVVNDEGPLESSAGAAGDSGGMATAGEAGGPSPGGTSSGGASAAGGSAAGGSAAGGSANGGSANGGSANGGSAAGASAAGAGAPAVAPRSCTGLDRICGADAASDCCSAHAVPGGDFNRLNNTTLGYAATVSDFTLDDFEITVGRFRKFVTAYNSSGKKPPAVGSGKNPNNRSDPGWLESYNASLVNDLAAQVSCGLPYQTWTDELGANEARPINCLSWYTAEAFCIWDGGRLPTLAEWSYAAVGGAQQRYYPWSKPPNDTTISQSNASYDCMGDGSPGCALTDLVRVGSKPSGVGRWLQADLSGNVSEWVQDWYAETPLTPCKDCANLDPGSSKFRDIMGGSFEKNAFNQQTSGGSSTQPVNTEYMTGARCARN